MSSGRIANRFEIYPDWAIEILSPDQENLIQILQKRLRDRRRNSLVKDVQEAQKEFAEGKCRPVTPAQLMEELLS